MLYSTLLRVEAIWRSREACDGEDIICLLGKCEREKWKGNVLRFCNNVLCRQLPALREKGWMYEGVVMWKRSDLFKVDKSLEKDSEHELIQIIEIINEWGRCVPLWLWAEQIKLTWNQE